MGGVRIATDDDAAAVAAVYAPYVTDTAISFEMVPPSADEMRARMAAVLPTYPWLVFEDESGVAAYAYASAHAERAAYRWSVDAAIYASAGAHRRGMGRALYGRLFDLLARQGFHAAYAGIALPNARSVGLHEAMGFTHVGTFAEVGYKFGAWHDVGWWRRSLGQGAAPAEPIPFARLLAEAPRR